VVSSLVGSKVKRKSVSRSKPRKSRVRTHTLYTVYSGGYDDSVWSSKREANKRVKVLKANRKSGDPYRGVGIYEHRKRI
jgi:hypothetical protein